MDEAGKLGRDQILQDSNAEEFGLYLVGLGLRQPWCWAVLEIKYVLIEDKQNKTKQKGGSSVKDEAGKPLLFTFYI